MITGRFNSWNGVFGLFTPDEIEVWDSPEAGSDIRSLVMLDEHSWPQEDVCLGEWVVDCISYDPSIMPDMLIVARRPSGMGLVFLLKFSSREEKTGYLMRTHLPEYVEQSIFAKHGQGKKINCRLVLAEALDPSEEVVHMLPFRIERTRIDGSDIVAFTVPRSTNRKAA